VCVCGGWGGVGVGGAPLWHARREPLRCGRLPAAQRPWLPNLPTGPLATQWDACLFQALGTNKSTWPKRKVAKAQGSQHGGRWNWVLLYSTLNP
jgi:hypothetical protein